MEVDLDLDWRWTGRVGYLGVVGEVVVMATEFKGSE